MHTQAQRVGVGVLVGERVDTFVGALLGLGVVKSTSMALSLKSKVANGSAKPVDCAIGRANLPQTSRMYLSGSSGGGKDGARVVLSSCVYESYLLPSPREYSPVFSFTPGLNAILAAPTTVPRDAMQTFPSRLVGGCAKCPGYRFSGHSASYLWRCLRVLWQGTLLGGAILCLHTQAACTYNGETPNNRSMWQMTCSGR